MAMQIALHTRCALSVCAHHATRTRNQVLESRRSDGEEQQRRTVPSFLSVDNAYSPDHEGESQRFRYEF
jgi:hypothetical protein